MEKKKKKEKRRTLQFCENYFMNISHILHQITSKFVIGVNFHGDLHLDVELK